MLNVQQLSNNRAYCPNFKSKHNHSQIYKEILRSEERNIGNNSKFKREINRWIASAEIAAITVISAGCMLILGGLFRACTNCTTTEKQPQTETITHQQPNNQFIRSV